MDIYNQPWKLVQNKIRGAGGREIDKLRGINPPTDTERGSEAWIGSVTRVGNPPVDNPNYGCSETILPDGRRMFLFEAIELDPLQILGKNHIERNGHGMGMLVKYLDAQAKYDLQCHPTRQWAKEMWDSNYGKEESWYVIGTRDDTPEPAYILLGFKDGVTRADWERHYYANDVAALENLCHKIPVQVGEVYFVGGGVPHALGEGCFVIEVQEPCDITLTAYSFETICNRKRIKPADKELYDKRLLGAYQYDGCTYDENLKRWRIPRKLIRSGKWGKEEVVIGTDQTPYFSFSELCVNGEIELRHTGFPQVGIVLNGSGSIGFDKGEMEINRGDEVFLPYHIPNARINGNLTIVLCHPEGVVI